ncbi:MAG: acyl-CoA thioesterase [Acidobacteriota bacterium]|nr:acyl-CoA thioesterase [Acidobacteriota bacterium]
MQPAAQPFELAIAIKPTDIDRMGHVNNVTYLRWVQDVAVAHWRSLASPADQASWLWVVLRHEIDYKRAAYLDDAIVARTWVGTANRLRFERHTELLRASDRSVLAKARTVWCPLDARSGKPVSVSDRVRAVFSVEPPSATSVL